jgi:hypothetical protein
MLALCCDLAQVARIELEGDVLHLTRSEMDTREAFEREGGGSGRVWALAQVAGARSNRGPIRQDPTSLQMLRVQP